MTWNNSIFPLLLITSTGGFTGEFVYSSAQPGLGTLIGSDTAAAGTDPYGNAFLAGRTGYSAAGAVRLAVQLSSGSGITQAIRLYTATSAAGPWTAQGSVGVDTSGNLYLVPGSAGGGVAIPSGSPPANAPAGNALLTADANSLLRMVTPISGDTNAYFMGWSVTAASAVPQTISSTTATTITGCTFAVGAGLYRFRARVTFNGGAAAGTANFSVTGPATSNAWTNALFNMSNGTAGSGAQNAALGPLISPTLTTGQNVADIEGDVTFSASGTMALACAEGTAGDTVIIQHAHFWLYPIT